MTRPLAAAFLLGLFGPIASSADDATVNPVVGRPKAFKAGKQPSVALWYGDTWNLEVTTKSGKKDVFTGSVRFDKGRVLGKFEGLEKGTPPLVDWVVPHKDGGGFDFQFTNVGKLDVVRFQAAPEATTMRVTVLVDGQPTPGRVFVGKAGVHPAAVPFVLPAHPKK